MTIQNKKNEIYSFDIFDTLVTRTVAEPRGIFLLVQKHLQKDDTYKDFPEILKDNFYLIRTETENFTRKNLFEVYDKKEITIYDIYANIKNNYSLTEEQHDRLLNLELETEKANLVPIEENINKIKSLVNDNKKVVLITDMYLPQNILKEILCNIDKVFENIEIFTSCEYNCAKCDGGLYECVKNKLGLDSYEGWHHLGDNRNSDYNNAKKLGIKAELYTGNSFLPYEKYAIEKNNNADISSIIGIAKYTRLKNKDNDKHNIYDFGCSYAAPILYGYVKYIIEDSLKNNTKSLYFIARDGYVLKEIADIIIKKKNLDIKTKYIYGSRKAWRIPTEYNIDDFINWVFDEYTFKLTINFIAERFGVNTEIVSKYLKDLPIDKKLKIKQRLKAKDILLNSDNFKSDVVNATEKKKDLLVKYLKQEINFDTDKIILVDLCGTGRSQDSLSEIINHEIKRIQVQTYYFTNDNEVINTLQSKKMAYYPYTGKFFLLELLCRAEHGQTLKYLEDGESIKPVLEELNTENIKNWGFDEYMQGLCEYAKNVILFEKENLLSISYIELFNRYVEYLNNPNKYFAELIGKIPYVTVGSEINAQEMAPKLTLFQVFKYLITGKSKSDIYFLSCIRTGKYAQSVNNFVEKYGSLRKFMINVYINKTKKSAYVRFLGIKISISALLWRDK